MEYVNEPARSAPGCNNNGQLVLMPVPQCWAAMHAQVEGMTCSNCSSAVERILHGARGVRRANVALTLGEARVTYDPAFTDEARIAVLVLFRVSMHIVATAAASPLFSFRSLTQQYRLD
jgi:copper chaperone CopZ